MHGPGINIAHHSFITCKFNRIAIRLSYAASSFTQMIIYLIMYSFFHGHFSDGTRYPLTLDFKLSANCGGKKVSAKVHILHAKKKVQMRLRIAVFDSNSSQSGDKTSN